MRVSHSRKGHVLQTFVREVYSRGRLEFDVFVRIFYA
jgi:hypothetical protein